LSVEADQDRVKTEQVSLSIGGDFVISFQDSRGGVFGTIRKRLLSGKGRIRKKGADYLAYALLDAIVDNYFIMLERFGERLEELEEELANNPRRETLQAIHELRRENIFLRKSTWPLREVISGLERSESNLLGDGLDRYLKDLYDHTIQIIDIIETNQDLVAGMLDLYLSSVSNRMNEVMKVLTIFASIFIPLTFIAGVYGMNFEFMPELSWRWSYPVLWLIMITGALGMLLFFKKKGWF
ncbi:MAG: magnesium/cobalt transporter CorA, partial [Syntrophales bacterium]|nr:magnesium/cobalt transporter CorA [Syntrophales bacterium]